MKLTIEFSKESTKRLKEMCETIDAIGLIEKSFPCYERDLIRACLKAYEEGKFKEGNK